MAALPEQAGELGYRLRRHEYLPTLNTRQLPCPFQKSEVVSQIGISKPYLLDRLEKEFR
jgi:hypothetical protein